MKKIIATVLAVSAASSANAGSHSEIEIQSGANLANSFAEYTQTSSLSRSVSKEDLFYDESSDDEQSVIKEKIDRQTKNKTEKTSMSFSGLVSSWISAVKTVAKKLISLFW